MTKDNINPSVKFHFSTANWSEPRVYDHISVFEAGDLSCKADYHLESQVQLSYGLYCVLSGSGWFSADNRRCAVQTGHVVISLPQQVVSGGADPLNPFRFAYLKFSFNYHRNQASPFDHIQKMLQKTETLVRPDQSGIIPPFKLLLQELLSESDYSDILITAYLNQLLVLVYRNFCLNWENNYTVGSKMEGNKAIIRSIISYLDDHILNIIDLTQVAKALGYSYSYLSHIFSEETGLTLQAYYSNKKIEKAAQLLVARDLNITKIAEVLNYQSIHSFSKAFKKIMGLSPAQYQARERQTQQERTPKEQTGINEYP